MSVSAISSNPAAAPRVSTPPPAAAARATDGDYKVKNPKSSQVKDSDGDYKALAASGAAAAKSSASVQSALAILKVGG
jgi:hypothetical protein